MTLYSWYDLPWRERRRVVRLAKRGQRHPDPVVARLADEWSKEVLGDGPGVAGGVVIALIGLVFQDGSWFGTRFAEKRAARRIRSVAERST